MRSKEKTIKGNEKVEAVFKKSYVIVFLEDMRDDIKLIIETQNAMIKELREFKVKS